MVKEKLAGKDTIQTLDGFASSAACGQPREEMISVLKNILDGLDAYVYVSDLESDEILFVNKKIKETFHFYDIAAGTVCWQVVQKGFAERCSFCPLPELKKEPGTSIVWEAVNTVTGRYHRNMDSVIDWVDGKKVHLHYAIDITESRRVQQDADKMLGILKNILNGMDAYVYVSDMETDEILFINNRMQKAFELDESAIGKICWQVLQSGFTERCSFCPNHKLEKEHDATVVWEEHNTVTGRHYKNVDSVIEWMDGKKVHMQHSADITDILEAQRETRETRERLEMAMTASQAGVWEIDLVAGILSYDQLCGSLFAFDQTSNTLTLDELVSHLKKYMLKVSGSDVIEALLERDPYAHSRSRDFQLVFPDGAERYIRNYGNTIRDDDGKALKVIGMCIDITQTVKLENELKAAKIAAEDKGRADADARTQVMLDATPLAASFWDEKGNMLDCNMEAVRLFGLSQKADYMEHFYELNPEYQPDGELTAAKAEREIGETFKTGMRRFEWMYKTPAGEPLPVETTLVRVPWKGEYRLAAYSRDLREIRAIEQKRIEAVEHSVEMEVQARAALASSDAKSQFLSNMSHEIRTPMNAIIGMAELLSNERLTGRQKRYVDDIKTSSTSLLGIINDILDFSKIEAGKLQLIPVDYDVKKLLRNLESMFTFAAQTKGISFFLRIESDLPSCVYGDDIRVRQALINILGNAVKFTKTGGVTLIVRASGDMLYFDIKDTGIGIKEEELPKIYNDFDQLDTQNNRNITGTGLGLSITKNLIGLMGGKITVESEYGKGTVFHLAIPLVYGDEKKLLLEQDETAFVNAPDASILVVDDNEVNLSVAVGLLSLYGISCDTAQSGQEAIDKIKHKKYDIVFMDHMMPEMDGVETTGILRQSYAQDKLTIIALTANAIEGVSGTLLKAGMNDYLTKPIDRNKLNQILVKWLPPEKAQHGNTLPIQEGHMAQRDVFVRLEGIAGLDSGLGLKRVAGAKTVYLKTLGIMEHRLPASIERMQSFVAKGDLKGLAIEVHGAKGSLNNIGATGLAGQAEELEMSAKQGDAVLCRGKLPALAEGLAKLQQDLSLALMEQESAVNYVGKGDRGLLSQQLLLVKRAIETFEGDEALERLRSLAEYDYGQAANEKLKEICQTVEEFDFDKSLKIIEKI